MKFRLTADHYTNTCVLVPAGAEVGEGTAFPLTLFGEPSMNMEPLDDAAREAWKARHESSQRPIDSLNINSVSRKNDPTAALHDRDRPPDPTDPNAPPRQPGKPITQPVTQPAMALNPILPTPGDPGSGRQPILPPPSEHVQPGPVGRPDPARSPEERQHDRDVMAETPTNDAVHAVAATGPVEPPSPGNPGEGRKSEEDVRREKMAQEGTKPGPQSGAAFRSPEPAPARPPQQSSKR